MHHWKVLTMIFYHSKDIHYGFLLLKPQIFIITYEFRLLYIAWNESIKRTDLHNNFLYEQAFMPENKYSLVKQIEETWLSRTFLSVSIPRVPDGLVEALETPTAMSKNPKANTTKNWLKTEGFAVRLSMALPDPPTFTLWDGGQCVCARVQ